MMCDLIISLQRIVLSVLRRFKVHVPVPFGTMYFVQRAASQRIRIVVDIINRVWFPVASDRISLVRHGTLSSVCDTLYMYCICPAVMK